MTLDKTGRKMSKSLGNTLDPKKVINAQGADILRLWAASVDFTEDHRIGDEILKTVSDSYRKLRNTFRYMLGALADYDADAEMVAYDDMPELERYILHRLAALDAVLKQSVHDFAFGKYVRAISDFVNDDLSAFFFDIRKDCLYCDVGPQLPHGTDTRRAYRTVVNILFEALTRYIAPVLVFTAEEIWMTRYPDGESVHLAQWPNFAELLGANISDRHSREGGNPEQNSATVKLDSHLRGDDEMIRKINELREFRKDVNEELESLRREKIIGSSLEARLEIWPSEGSQTELFKDLDTSEFFIVSECEIVPFGGLPYLSRASDLSPEDIPKMQAYENEYSNNFPVTSSQKSYISFTVSKTEHHKCGRCWRLIPDVPEDGALCGRCDSVLNG